jgi:hypothetical protein
MLILAQVLAELSLCNTSGLCELATLKSNDQILFLGKVDKDKTSTEDMGGKYETVTCHLAKYLTGRS